MEVKKSPGQKRKKIVIIFSVVLFLVGTYGVGSVFQKMTNRILSWVDNHEVVSAQVSELSYEVEEYRNRKGRKRTRDVYYLSYDFSVNGEVISNDVVIEQSQYDALEQGGSVAVWYDPKDHYTNDTEQNIKSELGSNTIESHMFNAAAYTAPAVLFVYWLLSFIFVRESKKVLPEGFYTENSWLDVDDKYLVALDGSDLVYFDIDKSKVSAIQKAYQNDADLEELIGNSKSSSFKRIPLGEVTELISHHNSDVLSIELDGDTHSIEFLNQTVKAHALERISKHLPETLTYNKVEKSRIQAAIPSLIWLAVLVGVVYYVDIFLLNILVGIYALISVLPKMIGKIIDPTVTQTWKAAPTSDEPEPVAE